MQSTGQTSTQDRSLMSMQGSAMMYVIGAAHSSVDRRLSCPFKSRGQTHGSDPRSSLLSDELLDDLRRALLQGVLDEHLVEAGLMRAAQTGSVGVPAEPHDRDVRIRVGDIVRIDTTDVGDDEVGPVGAVRGHEVMAGKERLELAPEEDIDPTEQDRRHAGSVPRL